MPGREVKQLETENKLKTKAAGLGFAVNKARQASSKSEREFKRSFHRFTVRKAMAPISNQIQLLAEKPVCYSRQSSCLKVNSCPE